MYEKNNFLIKQKQKKAEWERILINIIRAEIAEF